ncbi:MAG TPA: hypothetical protein VH277_10490 [Gemmatimonadaceae bacterium]|jgi:hypothetical protein|nr:hypothetical protein [Gemmatimonadaceae bacterium]
MIGPVALNSARRVLAVVAILCVGTGCYQYSPAPLAAVQRGQAVRVTLTPAGATALASAIGPGATALDGRVVRRTSADVTLALTQIARGPDEPEQFLQNDPLTLPLATGPSFALRVLDRPRTALALGGIVAVIVAGRIVANQPGIFSTKATVSQSTK